MPHITISMYPGRDDELKGEMAQELINTMIEKFNIPEEALSISIEDIEVEDFEDTINQRLNDENRLFIPSTHIKE